MKNLNTITSATNPFVKQLRALASSKKARQESNTFIIEGWRGIDTLLTHQSAAYTLEKLVISPEWENDPRLPATIDTTLLPDVLFQKISEVKNAQGILGIVRYKSTEFNIPAENARLLLLDNIRDPGNLGTLIRSAVGSGFDGILLYGDCVEPFNPKVIRSTMGTFAFTHLWKVTQSDLDALIDADYEICVTTGIEGGNLYQTAFSPKTVLVIGSEAHGASEELFELATKKITIPIQPQCESLNAAIAGSICMFHMQNA